MIQVICIKTYRMTHLAFGGFGGFGDFQASSSSSLWQNFSHPRGQCGTARTVPQVAFVGRSNVGKSTLLTLGPVTGDW